ncbi:MAG TPA: glycerophosphodiester phosphodiesterase [Acidimicrobiales bacterium]
MKRWAYLDHPGPLAFAHRGGAADFPENTMLSFESALRLGYRYLETDVRTTSDGVLLTFHDEVLDRVTDMTGRLGDLPWSEVSKARIDGQPIPRLEEVLAAWPDARVNIDAKMDEAVAPLAEVIERVGAHDRVCVAAFTDLRLRQFRLLTGGRVCTAMGPRAIARLKGAGYRAPTGPFAAGCVQVPLYHGRIRVVDRRFVAAAHRRGIHVHVWTIDEPAEMDRLLDLGVDGIMTDRPTVLRDVLERRGEWVGRPA